MSVPSSSPAPTRCAGCGGPWRPDGEPCEGCEARRPDPRPGVELDRERLERAGYPAGVDYEALILEEADADGWSD